ncbi:hypothetical protein [Pseudoalteromonas sp. meg-B1]|uniref:hypothetical protein n=1 Tax=Pseudoalteromonas sp. meg-B1 TaxID=2203192 RepID=UPI000D70253F|nr:hypothetical protein [Pseudoalteromonas sp. meg-B1]PWS55825.1 hypothetical protein DK924_03395 [Pseudoalteromonas sp. meg-B1]
MDSNKKQNFVIDEINLGDFEESLSNFTKTISNQFTKIIDTSSRLLTYKTLDENNLTDKELELLNETNYEISALKGEPIVLFDKPYLVSDIDCGRKGHFADEKSLGLRFLSHKNITRKVVFPAEIKTNQNNYQILSYAIDDIIWGVILPPNSSFRFARALDIEELYKNREILSNIEKTHRDITVSVDLLRRDISKKINISNDYLEERRRDAASLKVHIQSYIQEKERIEESVAIEQSTIDRIRKEIKHDTENLRKIHLESSKVQESITENRSKEEDAKNSLTVVNDSIATNNLQLEKNRKELADMQSQLAKIRADVNITTLDMKGFSIESQSQISKYYWLSLFILAFIATVFGYLYSNAATFSELFDANPKASLWNILLSRLPLVTATTLIIGTLSGLLFFLIKNIVAVSENKMNMLKASILAEQITGSIPKSDMTEGEIRDFKRNTKIELVMNIFAHKSENAKDEKQIDTIKQMLEAIKSLKP